MDEIIRACSGADAPARTFAVIIGLVMLIPAAAWAMTLAVARRAKQ